MGESVFDYFYFNGQCGYSEMPTLDRSKMLLQSHVLDEGKKTKTIIRPLADVAKELISPFGIQFNNKKVKACDLQL